MKNESLETAMARLDEILKILESNQDSLEKQIELYKEAMDLTKYCNDQLADFEKRVAEIIKE